MLQEYDQISFASSTMPDLQNLLQTADSLLQKDQIKEALKLYEHSKKPQFSLVKTLIKS